MAGSVLFTGTYIKSEDQNDDQLGGRTHSGWGDPDDFNPGRCARLSWLPSVLGIVGGALKHSLLFNFFSKVLGVPLKSKDPGICLCTGLGERLRVVAMVRDIADGPPVGIMSISRVHSCTLG